MLVSIARSLVGNLINGQTDPLWGIVRWFPGEVNYGNGDPVVVSSQQSWGKWCARCVVRVREANVIVVFGGLWPYVKGGGAVEADAEGFVVGFAECALVSPCEEGSGGCIGCTDVPALCT